jgi:hypothetical protein
VMMVASVPFRRFHIFDACNIEVVKNLHYWSFVRGASCWARCHVPWLCECLGGQVGSCGGGCCDVGVLFTDFASLMRVSCLWRWPNLHCWSFVRGASIWARCLGIDMMCQGSCACLHGHVG